MWEYAYMLDFNNIFQEFFFFFLFQASHFFWGLWALIQAKYSTIDFDFLG